MKLNITLPVLNEERQLPRAVAELTTFLRANIGGSFEVVIVDNGSTDGTWAEGRGGTFGGAASGSAGNALGQAGR
jgi:glycosyltransferase involved in cell wall biosynthesis